MNTSKLPFSQFREAGSLVFLSGQVGQIDGKVVSEDFSEQFHQATKNVENILEAASLTFAQITDVTIFLVSMDDYDTLNGLYLEWLSKIEKMPTRTCVAVAALPLGAKVELKVLAAR